VIFSLLLLFLRRKDNACECRIAAEEKKIVKIVKKSRVCHNLATWRCIFAAQFKIYEYEKGFKSN
jgi:hypothetical protein